MKVEKVTEKKNGYDKLTYDVHKPMYEQTTIYDETQYVPWKSISSAGTDQILVKYTDYDTIIKPDHVKFRTAAGIALTVTQYEGNDNLRLLNVTGKTHEETEGIEAYLPYKDTSDTEKEKLLGKLNTISYDQQNINVIIVPVNGGAGFSATEFTNALKNIYKQSVVTWNVTLDDVFNIDQDDWDKDDPGDAGYGKMNDGESTLLSNYSDEQNKLKRKYKNSPGVDIDKQAYYVFLLNGIESQTGLAGYMPLKEQYAFIYSSGMNARTIAHELGHGAFRLWHTFSSESNYYMAQGSSDNLMDYAQNAERLHKYQWDFIHNPEGGFYMFQDEDEAAMIDILSLLSDIRQANLDEKEIYQITKDQCPEVLYKDVTIGEDKLSYLGIKCTDDFEPTEEEQQNVDFVDWQLEYGEKIKIMPNKKNKTYFNSTLGNAVRYKFYEAIEHDPPMVNEQSNNKLFELLILEKDVVNFEKYVFPPKYHEFEVSKVNEGLDDAIDDGEGFNASGAACNICVRAALHYIANDNVLFPYAVASAIGAQGTQSYNGKISGIGKANNQYVELAKWQNTSLYGQLNSYENKLKDDDFNAWVSWATTESEQQNRTNKGANYLENTNYKISEFEHISKDVTITIDNQEHQVPNFNNLQSQANDGVLIIGVRRNTETRDNGNYKSGHIVIISPYVEGSGNEEDRKDYKTTTGVTIYFPRTVECGGNIKKLGWLSKDFAKDMEWYRYK